MSRSAVVAENVGGQETAVSAPRPRQKLSSIPSEHVQVDLKLGIAA